MAVQLILSTDKLQSGFRSKYNLSVNEIITTAVDNGDGTVTFTKFGGGIITLDLTTSFFTITEVQALIAALGSPIQPIEIIKSETDLVADGGNWYLEYRIGASTAVGDGIMPYSIISLQGTHTYPIPALLEDDTLWTYPRIYGFPDPATAQTITIFAI